MEWDTFLSPRVEPENKKFLKACFWKLIPEPGKEDRNQNFRAMCKGCGKDGVFSTTKCKAHVAGVPSCVLHTNLLYASCWICCCQSGMLLCYLCYVAELINLLSLLSMQVECGQVKTPSLSVQPQTQSGMQSKSQSFKSQMLQLLQRHRIWCQLNTTLPRKCELAIRT